MSKLIKSPQEISKLKKSAKILADVLYKVQKFAKPGMTLKELDQFTEELILSHNCKPAFKGHEGFPATICTAIDDEVVHGIPKNQKLEEGQILTVDCGVNYQGYLSDSAVTFGIGKISTEKKHFIDTVQQILYKAIEFIKPGVKTGDLGHYIQSLVEKEGFHVFKELIGHGIGTSLWEPPHIPNFGRPNTGTMLKAGMVICVEPIVGQHTDQFFTESDGWTIKSVDGSLGCQQEHMLLITDHGCEVLTQRSDEKI